MYHYDIKSLNLGTDTLRMMRSRTSLLQMLAAESACVMNGTHDGFWDAVHVDEVIINVGVGKDARDCDCSVNVAAGSPAVVCITQHFVALICLRIFCACHYVAATVGCWGQPVLYFFYTSSVYRDDRCQRRSSFAEAFNVCLRGVIRCKTSGVSIGKMWGCMCGSG